MPRRLFAASLLATLPSLLAGCPRAQPSPPAASAPSASGPVPAGSAAPSAQTPDPLRDAMHKLAAGEVAPAKALLAGAGQALSARRADVFGAHGGAQWSPEGSHVALRMGRFVRIIDARSSREVGARPIPLGFGDEHLELALGPKGALLASFRSSDDGQVELWDTARGERLAVFPADIVHGRLALSPDGATLAFATRKDNGSRVANQVALIDTRSLQLKLTIPTPHLWKLEFVDQGARLRVDTVTYSVDTGEMVSKEPPGLVRGPSGLGVRPSTNWGTVHQGPAVVQDLASGVDLGELEAPGCEKAEHALFGPAPRSLIATIDGGHVCLWDPSTRSLLRRIDVPLDGAPRIALSIDDKVRFTPDGKAVLIAVSRNEDHPRIHAYLYDVSSGAQIEDIGKVMLLADPTRPGPTGERTRLDTWMFDRDRGELLRASTAAPVSRQHVSWKDTEVAFPTAWAWGEATVGQDGLRLFDARTGQVQSLTAEPGQWSVYPSPDGKWLAAQSDGGVSRIYRLSPRAPTFVASTAPRPRPVAAIHFAPSGDALAVASAITGEERLTLATGELRSSRAPGVPSVVVRASVTFSRDGESVIVPARPETETAVDLRATFLPSGRAVTLAGTADALVGAIALSPDSKSLAAIATETGGWDTAQVKVWDLSTGKVRSKISRIGPVDVAFDPKGSLVATGGTFIPGLEVWDARSGRQRFSKPDLSVERVLFSPDGATLAYVADGTARLLSVARKRDTCSAPARTGWPLAFSPDGATFAATAADHAVSLFRTRDCSPVRALSPALDEAPASLAFHPSGKLLGAATEQGEIRLFSLVDEPREPVLLLLSPGGAAAFSQGKIELFGDRDVARQHVRCQASGYVFPFELCEEQSLASGLLAALLR